MIQAVIFDLDGTLIDTEKYYRRCWRQAFADFGHPLTEDQVLMLRSLGTPFVQELFSEWCGDSLKLSEVKERRQELLEECIRIEGVQQKKGAAELLAYLKEKGIVTAVATASDPDRTGRYLQKAGLDSCFDHICTTKLVEKGKPAPDVYLYTCAQLGLEPADCLAVEDSPNGIKSAWSAGCKVIMVPDQTPMSEDLAPMLTACVEDLAEIRGVIEKLQFNGQR